VVPVPDEERGSVVKAYVVLTADYDPSDELIGEIRLLQERDRPVQVPAPDRVHRRAAKDRERQDPTRRAPPTRGSQSDRLTRTTGCPQTRETSRTRSSAT
jgi:hypothetical protein